MPVRIVNARKNQMILRIAEQKRDAVGRHVCAADAVGRKRIANRIQLLPESGVPSDSFRCSVRRDKRVLRLHPRSRTASRGQFGKCTANARRNGFVGIRFRKLFMLFRFKIAPHCVAAADEWDHKINIAGRDRVLSAFRQWAMQEGGQSIATGELFHFDRNRVNRFLCGTADDMVKECVLGGVQKRRLHQFLSFICELDCR